MTRARAFPPRLASGRRPTESAATHSRSFGSLPQPGDTIADKYRIARVIGQGGMAVVYEATHLRLHQRLAIKVLRPDIPDFEEVLARFEREARATAQLRSIHTAHVVDVDTLPDGLPYIVMEYLDGTDLDAALAASGPMPVEQAVDVTLQVADAVAEAHDLGIVHRDLKSANVFVCRVGNRPLVKVLDYGISKSVDDGSSRITGADSYFGTPCYAAPEQLRAAGDADARSDVWSLGVILFELLTGRTPFTGSSTAVIAKVMADPIPWPLDLRPDIPRELARVMLRALERDPNLRFQTMREFAGALEPFGPLEKASSVLVETHRQRGRLGEILVADGLLSDADLQRALVEQRRRGELLGRVLLDLGLVARADLLAALAKQQGIALSPTETQAIEMAARTRQATTGAPAAATRRRNRRWLVTLAVALPLSILGALAAGSALHAHQTSQSAKP
jgi:serine/threonine protein kinase